jgi:hypothetical protein
MASETLVALAFFLPTIVGGFESQFGTKFDINQKGLITEMPYLAGCGRTLLLEPRCNASWRQDLAFRRSVADRSGLHSCCAV